MSFKQYIVRNDRTQDKYIQQAYQTMIKQTSIHHLKKKMIQISDQFFSIEQIVESGLEFQQKRHQTDNLLFFIKYKLQYNKKMTLLKECIHNSIDLSQNGEEIYQIRNDSALCEQIKLDKYYLRRNNKIIRKCKFPLMYQCNSMGQLKCQTAILLVHQRDQSLNYVQYFLETGRSTDLQLTDKINSFKKRILVSKDEQYIYIGNTLRHMKNHQIISEIHSTYSQFSDCSRYFAYTDDFNFLIIDLSSLETCCRIQIPNIFYLHKFGQVIKKVRVDFKEQRIIFEDWSNKLLVSYYFSLKK